MIGKEVTVAKVDESGKVTGEKKGVVTGVDLTGGQYIYIGEERYSLSQIMGIGEVPKKEDGDTATGDGGTTEEGENTEKV